jgi:NAD(P)-dependent dehydrogenase (short-subunit alcohol dehydrogenase family)
MSKWLCENDHILDISSSHCYSQGKKRVELRFLKRSKGGQHRRPFYHGSKYALEGILESLAKEVGHLGIHVTAVEPGPFRTDWSGRSMTHSERLISDYDELYEPIREARLRNSGRQPGDPERAATAILQVLDDENPPRHLVLGSAALDALAASRAAFEEDVMRWEDLTRSTDFPANRQPG